MSKPPRWRVVLKRRPERALRGLPKEIREHVDLALLGFADEPRPEGCIKLTGYDNLYRLRVGDWRIVYAIEEYVMVVLVVEIASRGRAYRNL